MHDGAVLFMTCLTSETCGSTAYMFGALEAFKRRLRCPPSPSRIKASACPLPLCVNHRWRVRSEALSSTRSDICGFASRRFVSICLFSPVQPNAESICRESKQLQRHLSPRRAVTQDPGAAPALQVPRSKGARAEPNWPRVPRRTAGLSRDSRRTETIFSRLCQSPCSFLLRIDTRSVCWICSTLPLALELLHHHRYRRTEDC